MWALDDILTLGNHVGLRLIVINLFRGGLLNDCGTFRLQRLSTDALLLSNAFCMNRRNTLIVIEFELGLIDKSFAICLLELKIVASCDMIMLIGVDALQHMVFLETKLDELV